MNAFLYKIAFDYLNNFEKSEAGGSEIVQALRNSFCPSKIQPNI